MGTRINEAQSLLVRQYDIASKRAAIADSTCDVESEMAEFLHTVQAYPEERARRAERPRAADDRWR